MFEERPDIQERLDGELVAWMTTVHVAGQPQTSPVWFLVEDEVIVVSSLDGTPRTIRPITITQNTFKSADSGVEFDFDFDGNGTLTVEEAALGEIAALAGSSA